MVEKSQMQRASDLTWMAKALKLAQQAEDRAEVPIGAVVVRNGIVVAKAFNRRETWPSPIAHAEVLALHRAAQKLGAWRLTDCELFVTLEPCIMCAGLLVQARIKRVIYGAKDPKGGGVESLYQITEDRRLNHQVEVTSGVMAKECQSLLQNFFKRRRLENKAKLTL